MERTGISPEGIAKFVRSVQVTNTYKYEGYPISFSNTDGLMVNATEMAKPFGKQPKDWLKTQSAKDFISAINEVKNILSSDLLKVIYGDNGGTWMHEDVAMEFARWLSPKFAIWCNDRIKELLTGQYSARPLTPAQQLLANAQMLVEMEQRQMEQERQQKALESRQTLTERRVNEIETRIRDNGFMAVVGFANIHHLNIGDKLSRKIGKQCAAWCRRMGVTPEGIKHEKYGHVNTYPMQALKDVFKANFPDKSAMFDIPTYWG